MPLSVNIYCYRKISVKWSRCCIDLLSITIVKLRKSPVSHVRRVEGPHESVRIEACEPPAPKALHSPAGLES